MSGSNKVSCHARVKVSHFKAASSCRGAFKVKNPFLKATVASDNLNKDHHYVTKYCSVNLLISW